MENKNWIFKVSF